MVQEYILSVEGAQLLTKDISQIILHAPTFQYEAGQYLYIMHDDESISPLSIACAPNSEKKIELHLSHASHNAPAQDILKMIQERKKLRVQGPFGSCTVKKFAPHLSLIFFAGGTGIAPVKAMLEELLPSSPSFPVFCYWSMGIEKDFYLREQFENWRSLFSFFHFTLATSKPVLQERVVRDHPDLSDFQVYASGPELLLKNAFSVFQQHHLNKERFYSD